MKSRVKALWLEALRSGRYHKGVSKLRTPTTGGPKYCCLGVLCDLYKKETGNGRWEGSDFVLGEHREYYHLPRRVQRWAGLNSVNPTPIRVGGKFVSLARINDGIVWLPGKNTTATFREIADIIEQRIPG